MRKRNDGTNEINAIQNRFTAYMVKAVDRRKIQYMQKKMNYDLHVISVDPVEYADAWSEELDMLSELPLIELIEDYRLLQAFRCLTLREAYIVVALANEWTYEDLARKLGVGYKGITSAHYRAIQKIRKIFGGEGK